MKNQISDIASAAKLTIWMTFAETFLCNSNGFDWRKGIQHATPQNLDVSRGLGMHYIESISI
jgi:hypothetical protein